MLFHDVFTDGGEGLNLDTRGHIDGAHRLVGKNHFGLVDDGSRDNHALHLTSGQVDRIPVQESGRFKANHGQSRGHSLSDLGFTEVMPLQHQWFGN